MLQIFSNSLGKEELDVINKVFESKWVGNGMECKLLESEFAAHLAVANENVLLFNCATSAIFIGLQTLGVSQGDEVIVSSVNFIACATAVLALGAIPVFADVDTRTLNILPAEIKRKKTSKTKAVIVLHYGGHPACMNEIKEACGNDILVFEDSANAIASTYHNQACGTIGDAGVWSCDAMKIVVMGDGGFLYIKDKELLSQTNSLRYLGLAPKNTSGIDSLQSGLEKWWEYEIDNISGRYTSNDLLASIGRVQLKKLNGFIERRKDIWQYYQENLPGIGDLILPPEPLNNCTSSYYFYWIQTVHRDELAKYLTQRNIYCTFRYYPLHLISHFNSTESLPNAEHVNNVTLNIPIHQNLSGSDLEKIVTTITDFYARL
jgi:dTDP-4-amino-4,6-dideoxygalactose transaminase